METQNDAPEKSKENLRARDKLAYNVKEAAAALGFPPGTSVMRWRMAIWPTAARAGEK